MSTSITELLEDCSEFLERISPKFAIILRNQQVLISTIQLDIISKSTQYFTSLFEKYEVGNLIEKSPLFFLKLTENVGIVLLTKTSLQLVQSMLELFIDRYYDEFDKYFAILPKSLDSLVHFMILSVSRQNGPEPLAWINGTTEISEEQVFKYALSSLMLLMNEIDGAKRGVLNFHPFISDNYLGVIYLFQIPLKEARGNAFDTALLIMFDYEQRTILYNLHQTLESLAEIFANKIISQFQNQFKENIQAQFNKDDRIPYTNILKEFMGVLKTVRHTNRNAEQIKQQMLDVMKQLKKI